MLTDNNFYNNFKQIGKVNLQFDVTTKTALILNSTDKICETFTIEYLESHCDSICKKFESKVYTLFKSFVEKDGITIYISVFPLYKDNKVLSFFVLADYAKKLFTIDEIKRLIEIIDHDNLNSLSLINMANDRVLAKADPSLTSYCNVIKENIEISSFVESHCNSIKSIIENADISFENTGNCFAVVDTSLLSSALLNLISNAVKYKTKDSSINVSVSKTYTYAKITVSNKTAEVDQKSIKRIFDLGYTTADKINTQGKGYGLYLVDKIAKYHDGKISAKLNRDVFSVTLYLPNSRIHNTELSSAIPNIEPANIKAFFIDIK